jgi:formate transporter
MSFGARTTIGKVMVIVPPISAFVAAGFEHSIANLYLLRSPSKSGQRSFWTLIGLPAATDRDLTVGAALHNIIVARIGNLVGGSLMVGAVYWFMYFRGRT